MVVLCFVVLAGWQFDVVALRSLLADAPQTMPATAIMLLMLAGALAILRSVSYGGASSRWVWLSRALAGGAVLFAVWMSVQYLFDLGPGIEVVFFPEAVADEGGVYPGRSSPQTLVSVFLLGLSILLLPAADRRVRRVAHVLAFMGVVLPWLAIFGYASAINPIYELPANPQTGISPLTAAACLALGIAVLSRRPKEAFFGVLTAPSAGGQVVRWLLPVVLVAPILFGWIVSDGQGAGLFDPRVGLAISWGLTSVFLCVLVIWQGNTVHHYEARLRVQSRALERSNRDLQQFAYVASHDLKAPLRRISAFSELLQQTYGEQLDAEANDWLGRIVRGADRMKSMVDDVLAFSSIDSSARPPEPVPLAEIYREVRAVLEPLIRQEEATVTSDALPTVLGDRAQLTLMLQNLVENALKYVDDGPPEVHVSARREEDAWVIAVRDNGPGIEPRYRKRVFDMFERLDAGRAQSGTGVGLAICRRIAERHGGEIWVTSAPEGGSIFQFSLPDVEDVPHERSTAPLMPEAPAREG